MARRVAYSQVKLVIALGGPVKIAAHNVFRFKINEVMADVLPDESFVGQQRVLYFLGVVNGFAYLVEPLVELVIKLFPGNIIVKQSTSPSPMISV